MGTVTSALCTRLRTLCTNCIMAPQNRNVGDAGLRPYCASCTLKWDAAVAIEQLQTELTATQRIAEVAAVRCRNDPGPCWCGCHISIAD